MLALYLAYRLFLARDNQHGFNRGVLLAIYVVSFTAYPILRSMENLRFGTAQQTFVFDGLEMISLEKVADSTPVWGTILIWAFIAGMAIVATRTVITWVRLVGVIRSGRKVERAGYTLVVTEDERYAPFSWMRYVVISRKDYESDSSAIATHELKHIDCHHWVDLLIAQVVCIVNWFNPAAWLMRDELMLVHEYQADMAVIDRGHDTQEYQMLLIKKAVGARFPSLANSLNHSKLKKRITMMYKAKSGAGRKWKALALVPMLALALGLTGVPAIRAAVSTISTLKVSDGKNSENPSKDKTTVQYFKVVNVNNKDGKTTVVIKGEGLGNSLTVSGGTFTTDGKKYKAKSLNSSLTDGNATITAVFPFITEFDKVSMTLNINGDDIPFDLENFFNNAGKKTEQKKSARTESHSNPVVIGYGTIKKPTADAKSEDPVVTAKSKGSAPNPEDIVIYLDGKAISMSDLNDINPDDIASITVDKKDNIIRIISKTSAEKPKK